MLKTNEIYLGNCLKVMRDIDDKSIDMILCDLPYGTTQNKWDIVIPFEPLWNHYKRVVKDNGAIVLTSSQPFTTKIIDSNIEQYRYDWIWKKNIATGHLNCNHMPMREHENVLVFYKKPCLYNPQMVKGNPYTTKRRHINDSGTNYNPCVRKDTVNKGLRYPKTILEFDMDKPRYHATQKPVALFNYMIKTYTNENDLVLDNCCGSGTTAISCLETNRRYICIELDKHFYNISNKRVEKFYKDNYSKKVAI